MCAWVDNFPLRSQGRHVVNRTGGRFKLAAVTWHGPAGPDHVVGGLRARPLKEICASIAAMGFTVVRLPFSSEMLGISETDLSRSICYKTNPDLAGLTPLEVLDKVIDTLGAVEIATVLCNRSTKACAHDVSDEEGLWFKENSAMWTEERWIRDWLGLAKAYADRPYVIGYDLRHEVRPSSLSAAAGLEMAPSWKGPCMQYRWSRAAGQCAQRIIKEENRGDGKEKLIIVERTGWPQASLREMFDPVPPWETLGIPRNRLILAVHLRPDTGPGYFSQKNWASGVTGMFFNAVDTVGARQLYGQMAEDELYSTMDEEFGFCLDNGSCPVWVSEVTASMDSSGGKGWFMSICQYLKNRNIDFGFARLNPGSSPDGLFGIDWSPFWAGDHLSIIQRLVPRPLRLGRPWSSKAPPCWASDASLDLSIPFGFAASQCPAPWCQSLPGPIVAAPDGGQLLTRSVEEVSAILTQAFPDHPVSKPSSISNIVYRELKYCALWDIKTDETLHHSDVMETDASMVPVFSGSSRPPASSALPRPPSDTFTVKVTVEGARGLRDADSFFGHSDPYCVLKIKGKDEECLRTVVAKDGRNPTWDHEAAVTCKSGDVFVFDVWDKDVGKADDHLGTVEYRISLDALPYGGDLTLLYKGKGSGSLTLKIASPVLESERLSPLQYTMAGCVLRPALNGTYNKVTEFDQYLAHGLPTYKLANSDADAFVYYWRDEANQAANGWYVAPSVGAEIIYAFCRGKDDFVPPGPGGWLVSVPNTNDARELETSCGFFVGSGTGAKVSISPPVSATETGSRALSVRILSARGLHRPANVAGARCAVSLKGSTEELHTTRPAASASPSGLQTIPKSKRWRFWRQKTKVAEMVVWDFQCEVNCKTGDTLVFKTYGTGPSSEQAVLGWSELLVPPGCLKHDGEVMLKEAGPKTDAYIYINVADGDCKSDIESSEKLQDTPRSAASSQTHEEHISDDPNRDRTFRITILKATGLRIADSWCGGLSDPYCVCSVLGRKGSNKTKVIKKTLDPVWDHVGRVSCKTGQILQFKIMDYDFGKPDDSLGYVNFTVPPSYVKYEGSLEILEGGLRHHPKLFLKIEETSPPLPEMMKPLGMELKTKIKEIDITCLIVSAQHLRKADWFGSNDPYCTVKVRGHKGELMRTKVAKDGRNPVWNHQGHFKVKTNDILEICVWDKDASKDDFLGRGEFTIGVEGVSFDGDLKLLEAGSENAALTVKLYDSPPEQIAASTAPTSAVPAGTRRVIIKISGATGLREATNGDTTPTTYCTCTVLRREELRFETPCVKDSFDPVWNCETEFPGLKLGEVLHFVVFSKIGNQNKLVGQAKFDVGPPPMAYYGDLELVLSTPSDDLAFLSVFIRDYFLADDPKANTSFAGNFKPLGARVSDDDLQDCGELLLDERVRAMQGRSDFDRSIDPNVLSLPHMPFDEFLEACKQLCIWKDGSGFTMLAGRSNGPHKALMLPDRKVSFISLGVPAGSLAAQQQAAARSTPNTAGRGSISCTRNLKITVVSASGLRNADGFFGGKSDPLCLVRVKNRTKEEFRTRVVKNSLNPSWNHAGDVKDLVGTDSLVFEVHDQDHEKKGQLLGRTEAHASMLLVTKVGIPQEHILHLSGHGMDKAPTLRITVEDPLLFVGSAQEVASNTDQVSVTLSRLPAWIGLWAYSKKDSFMNSFVSTLHFEEDGGEICCRPQGSPALTRCELFEMFIKKCFDTCLERGFSGFAFRDEKAMFKNVTTETLIENMRPAWDCTLYVVDGQWAHPGTEMEELSELGVPKSALQKYDEGGGILESLGLGMRSSLASLMS